MKSKLVNIRVIANASKNDIIEEEGRLKVKVNAPAVDGKANQAVIKLLANYFNTRKRNISIQKGERSRDKQIRIMPE